MSNARHPWQTIGILAVTQIAAWGGLYYAFALLAPEIQKEMGWRSEVVFGAFSWSLLVAGMVATPVGILLDRFGGRLVMGAGSAICGIGLIALSMTTSMAMYFLTWTVLGFAMAMTLYEAAFATINREFVLGARQGISKLTLFAGFASTVFWPLTLKLDSLVGWRDTYLIYGIAQLALCLPLHLLLARGETPAVPASMRAHQPVRSYTLREALRHPAFWMLALAFAANSFVFSAMSVHLIPLLQQFGHAPALTVFMAALIGPMQVAGRIGEMTIARHALPQTVGKFTFSALPAALLALLLFGPQQWAVAVFCIFYGLSNGILTIVRGTIPQALFGRENYGAISGAMSGPSLVCKAAGPLAIAAILHMTASPAPLLLVLMTVSLLSLAFYLAAVRAPHAAPAPHAALAPASESP